VDAGVFPILPSAHLSATAYAVAEKVSDASAVVAQKMAEWHALQLC
jgi:hypothetical protein